MKNFPIFLFFVFAFTLYANSNDGCNAATFGRTSIYITKGDTTQTVKTRAASYMPDVFFCAGEDLIEVRPNTDSGDVQIEVYGPMGLVGFEAGDAADGLLAVCLPPLTEGSYSITIQIGGDIFNGEFQVE